MRLAHQALGRAASETYIWDCLHGEPPLVADADLPEAHPASDTPDESITFRHPDQLIHYPAIHDAKIAGIQGISILAIRWSKR